MSIEDKIKQEQELAEYSGDDRVISFADKRAELKELATAEWSIRTELSGLDDVVGGFRPGNLIVVSGATSQGKTTLNQTITRNLSVIGIPSLWFPFEGDIRDFLERLHMVTVAGTLPGYLKSNSVRWVRKRIQEAVLKHGVKVVFIDHLHYLLSLESMGNASLTIGGIVRQLKLMAQEFNVVIFLICHIRKLQSNDKEGNFQRPGIDDIRDASLIGQEADYVMFIWREKDKKNSTIDDPVWKDEATLSLQKNRRTGKLCNVPLIMINKFFEMKEVKQDEPEHSFSFTNNS